MKNEEVKLSQRVRRKDGAGCYGVVREIRDEITATTGDGTGKALIVRVLWDNGTDSFLSPIGLELAD